MENSKKKLTIIITASVTAVVLLIGIIVGCVYAFKGFDGNDPLMTLNKEYANAAKDIVQEAQYLPDAAKLAQMAVILLKPVRIRVMMGVIKEDLFLMI